MTRYKVHVINMQSHRKRVGEAERGRKMVQHVLVFPKLAFPIHIKSLKNEHPF